ncbi:hypothetical protein [Hydrogenophaga sp.]|uniref:hypothetical protein n=1 Tax=Hydrogenophaga sp. TaxID=1904254 RepID=UPI0027314E39|nr:hypothetical protein [Hydrogenophaga sp.]MDP2018429.1 hypothetical protein [Hydrogenophaga sp.]MDP3165012.1 hypothetical protein [Hydrogenophaga sp.]MDP3811607.1 hypothetical protein [Hydrogenophaga sp.]
MSTTIPYSPSLVLGSIVEPAAMENLLAVSAAQTPIDAAQETLNSFISMKRSLEMTVQELINMGLDPKDLVKKVQEVGTDVDKAATAYATTRLEQELKLQPLRAKMQIVNASVESPVDYNRTQIKTMPLAADSLKMDAQFFTFDNNTESDSDTLSNIKSYVSAATSFLGQGSSFDMAKTAVDQVAKQRQLHKISGTLVLTATCTHKEAQVLAPLCLDVDKAIRVWNQLFPGAKDKIRMDESTIRQIAEQEGTTAEKSFNIISGSTLGSSFVGMVHVLNTESTTSSQDDDSRAIDMKGQLELGSAIASLKGGFGVDKNFAKDVKNLLSTQNITSHVTLITAGYIPTIKANQVSLGVKQFANFDPSDMMTSLAKLSDFTSADRSSVQQAATAARTKGEFVALKTATIESVMQSLSKLDDGQNSMLDISSMVVAFQDYVNTASAATSEASIGVPINYYLKPITRTQLAEMWVSKYYPNKYLDIQGDDTPRPKKDAAASS